MNVREPIGLAFVHRAHPKGHFNLRNLRHGFGIGCLPIRMYDFVLKVFLKLKIRYIERLKIIVEIKARNEDLRSSIGSLFFIQYLELLFNLDFVLSNL